MSDELDDVPEYTEIRQPEPLATFSDEEAEEVAEILHRKYSMFAGATVGGEPFNVSHETMLGIVTDCWLIISGLVPIEEWRD